MELFWQAKQFLRGIRARNRNGQPAFRSLTSAVALLLCDAEGEAALARENLEEELQGVKQRLAREVKLRAKEGKEFVDRLKEVQFASLSMALGACTTTLLSRS